ncbi:MAG: TlpA family protein disulfide reductase [Treponema sp.]|jgi:peroxiredoxin|nr:TlpA family protein disulfide reductase [Treponema sp.]
MKNILSVIFTICAGFLIFFPQKVEAQISPEAERALRDAKISVFKQRTEPRDFTLPLSDGGKATLSSYKGKVVILNFWATWCPPCRAEMPSMETMYQHFNKQDLVMLAVDVGEDALIVKRFIHNGGYTFPVLLDSDKKVSSVYGINAIPTTYIIDREGMIVGRIIGSIMWDKPKVIAAFDALLKS